MRTLISQKEFAQKVGINPSNLLRDFIKKGILPMEGKKIIMPDAEKIYYQIKGGVSLAKTHVLAPDELPIKSDNIDLETANATVQDLLDAKVKKENALGDIHEINLKKMRGELLSVEVVSAQVVTVCETIRNALINLPNKVAPLLEGLSAAEIQLRLDDEINEVLTDLYNLHNEYSDGAK